MNNSEFRKARAAQAAAIGTATMLAAYLPTSDEAADKAYIVDALDQIATMTRMIDTGAARFEDGDSSSDVDHKTLLCLGSTFVAKALSWAVGAISHLATNTGVRDDDDVLAAVSRVRSARKVLLRRELEHAVCAVERVAEIKGVTVKDLVDSPSDAYGGAMESVMSSIEVCKDLGVSRDFINRIRSRLGIE